MGLASQRFVCERVPLPPKQPPTYSSIPCMILLRRDLLLNPPQNFQERNPCQESYAISACSKRYGITGTPFNLALAKIP